MIKLGVDNGNYNTKSSEGMLYASGYAVSDKEFITPEMQLFYEGKYYAIHMVIAVALFIKGVGLNARSAHSSQSRRDPQTWRCTPLLLPSGLDIFPG